MKGKHTMRYVIIIAVALAGCSPSTPINVSTVPAPGPNFSRPGGTYQQYLADRLECIQTVPAGVYTCLAVKGWQRDPKGFPPPGKAG